MTKYGHVTENIDIQIFMMTKLKRHIDMMHMVDWRRMGRLLV